MRTRIVLPLTLLLFALTAFGLQSGAEGGIRPSAGSSYSDTAGDTAGSDITGLTITDDAAQSRLTFTLRVAALQPATELSVYLDTDRSEPAPRFWGSEYFMAWSQQPGDNTGWTFQRRSGSEWVRLDPSVGISFSRAGGVLSWTMTRADIGNPSGFNVYATAMDTVGAITTAQDIAPDTGFWSYDLAPPPPAVVQPVIGRPMLTPVRAVVGKRLAVSFPVTRSDTHAPLARATMICDPTIAGRLLPHIEQFQGGKARVAFLVPKSAKGQLLRVRLTIISGDQTARTSVGYRIAGR